LDDIYMDVAQNQLSHRALTPEDKQFLKRMQALYGRVAERGGDTRATRLRTARAYRRIGNVEQLFGEAGQAVEAYDDAIQLLDGLVAEEPQSRPYRTELALAHFYKGQCLAEPEIMQQQFPQPAESMPVLHGQAPSSSSPVTEFRASIQLFERLALSGPRRDYVLEWAECECALAIVVPTRGESLALLRHAEDLLVRAHFSKPMQSANARLTLARCARLLCYYLAGYEEKVEKMRHAITLFEQVQAGAPDNLHCALGLQRSRLDLAMLLAQRSDRVPGDKANRRTVNQLTYQVVAGLEKYAAAMPAVPWFPAQLWCTRNMLGNLLAQERNWPEARRQFGMALELARKLEAEHPQSAGGHHCTGCVLTNLASLYLDFAEHRDPAKALPYAQEAVKHEPSNVEFNNTLGEAYLRTGQYRAAVPLLLEYSASGFLYGEDWFLLSMVHWNLREKAQARCWYRLAAEYMAVQKSPTTKQRALRDEAAALLGMSLRSKATDDAEFTHDFQAMCGKSPAALRSWVTRPLDRCEPLIYANALNTLAWTCATSPDASLRDPQRAVRLAQYATTIMPREGFYVNTLGVAHHRAGHWKEAIAALTKSMELEKGALEAFDTFFLAMAHWQLGEKEKARQWYDRAVQWTETHRYQLQANEEWPEELQRFRAEAAKLLGITNSSKPPGLAAEASK
ncbi:MAG TPA: tetratricopeptide repeat protein, partial [Gemmataceae bacterium]|nr:tetratricopeptide repeat protein [Gemmataceae bacterium]